MAAESTGPGDGFDATATDSDEVHCHIVAMANNVAFLLSVEPFSRLTCKSECVDGTHKLVGEDERPSHVLEARWYKVAHSGHKSQYTRAPNAIDDVCNHTD